MRLFEREKYDPRDLANTKPTTTINDNWRNIRRNIEIMEPNNVLQLCQNMEKLTTQNQKRYSRSTENLQLCLDFNIETKLENFLSPAVTALTTTSASCPPIRRSLSTNTVHLMDITHSKQPASREKSIDSLPNEILHYIFEKLDPVSIIQGGPEINYTFFL